MTVEAHWLGVWPKSRLGLLLGCLLDVPAALCTMFAAVVSSSTVCECMANGAFPFLNELFGNDDII